MTNQFLKRPAYKPQPNGVDWNLTQSMKYVDPQGKLIIVPAGFQTDFASIPDLSRIGFFFFVVFCALAQFFNPWIFYALAIFPAWVVWISESFLHEGTWDDQSALHDYLYATRCRGFWMSNWILFKAMAARGGVVTPFWKRCIIFGGVTVGGYLAWVDDSRKR